jgi:hypothetical protein
VIRKIVRALPILAALVVIAAVAALRSEPGHHAPISAKGFLMFLGVCAVAEGLAQVLTYRPGQRRSRRSRRPRTPYSY